MDVALAILAAMQLLLVLMWLWLLARYARVAAELVELRARIQTMPTHTDLNELSVEMAGVKANTDQLLRLVNSMHSALMEAKR
jgi:hypothetical protein